MPFEEEVAGRTIQADIEAQAQDRRRSGTSTIYTCPECGGVLWQMEEHGLSHFQCHVGHAYSPSNMLLQKSQALESLLWAAARTLTEKATLTRQRLAQLDGHGDADQRARVEEIARLDEKHLNMLREVLLEAYPNPTSQAYLVEEALHEAGSGG